jgi:hypothetical protein
MDLDQTKDLIAKFEAHVDAVKEMLDEMNHKWLNEADHAVELKIDLITEISTPSGYRGIGLNDYLKRVRSWKHILSDNDQWRTK